MKSSLAIAASLGGAARAHYAFDKLVLPDGTVTSRWEYVRQHDSFHDGDPYPTTFLNNSQNGSPLDADFACNTNSTAYASRTGVAEVPAGSIIGMLISEQSGGGIFHQGPIQIYMSKAPTGAVVDYDGSGDWFMINQETTCNPGTLDQDAWCSLGVGQANFTIPDTLPTGEYLVRTEHIGLHYASEGGAEFYYSCAQVKVTGGGKGVPKPTVSIPGVYAADDPALNFFIWGKERYPYTPGPDVWTG